MSEKEGQDIETLLENEWYVVRHSGEIPEIALHSALYFLTRDAKGPKLVLSQEQQKYLQDAAITRFREILLRDISHENKEKTIYRGIERTIANWERFEKFCDRQQLSVDTLKKEVVEALDSFLKIEADSLEGCGCQSVLNCSFEEVKKFAEKLGLVLTEVEEKFSTCCCKQQAGEAG